MVMGQNKVKVIAWYDNEWGYSNRVVEVADKIGQLIDDKAMVKSHLIKYLYYTKPEIAILSQVYLYTNSPKQS